MVAVLCRQKEAVTGTVQDATASVESDELDHIEREHVCLCKLYYPVPFMVNLGNMVVH